MDNHFRFRQCDLIDTSGHHEEKRGGEMLTAACSYWGGPEWIKERRSVEMITKTLTHTFLVLLSIYLFEFQFQERMSHILTCLTCLSYTYNSDLSYTILSQADQCELLSFQMDWDDVIWLSVKSLRTERLAVIPACQKVIVIIFEPEPQQGQGFVPPQ